MKSAFTTVVLAVAAVVLPRIQPIPAALVTLADTERAFARRAAETTVRQAFIEFFADESVGFEPDPVPAREALRKRTTPQAPGFQLLWEPRLGDIAASGDLGYLTGPAVFVNPGRPDSYGCYFSVWKRQRDGAFRVILDVGIETPEKTPFASGFVRSAAVPAWKGREPRTQAEASLLAADQRLAAAIASAGASTAFAAVMPPAARMHRTGHQPMPRDAAMRWLARYAAAMTSEPMKAETSAAGDLGYTWGKYSATGETGAVSGYYVRAWTRTANGAWRLVADVTTVRR
jgi:ketosteroid isomerase-like protein